MDSSSGSIQCVETAATVQFVDISTSFDGQPVLTRLSLTVPAAETTILIGPSGAGKTTLMRHLLGLVEPDTGTVLVDGLSVWDLSQKELRRLRESIGVLLGGASIYDASLLSSRTVFENVAYPLRIAGVSPTLISDLVWQNLREFELVDVAESLPGSLPGGVRRRLGLAKTLVNEPRLVILDGPDCAGGLAHRELVVRRIMRAQQRTQATFLVITHDIHLARALGQRVAVLLDGGIASAGPVEELLDGVNDAKDLDSKFHYSAHFGAADVAASSVDGTHADPSQSIPLRTYHLTSTLTVLLLFVLLLIAVALAWTLA
jgi:ABC-type transporter Mla maintaining outer membrane lipid asymmetry ATPase subunit MlaF